MLNLAEYRRKPRLLADFLPWAALVGEGLVLNKDGSLQRSARFRGPDLDSATPAELVAVANRLNGALRRLGSGWTLFTEAQRIPATAYPESTFPDAVSALVEAERKAQFEGGSEGDTTRAAHYESRSILTLVWMPPPDDASRAEGWLYEGRDAANGSTAIEHLASFRDRTDRLLDLLQGVFPEAAWLDDGETLSYLHACISPHRQSVRVPETPMHLDALLADTPFTGGL
ncbi:MAG: conjugal transfer protein TrbE, partial [Pseudomonadota bacterium]